MILLGFLLPAFPGSAQEGNTSSVDVGEIVRKADLKMRGESSHGKMKMTIVRPNWTREMEIELWSKGTEKMLLVLLAPARDRGTAFLKRENEIWNWQPTIDRTIKMPPSMMMQSWMGSDFTNDDLVKESSIVKDYNPALLGEDTIEGRPSWKVKLTPKADAPVVWDEIITYISKEEHLQLKSEFYDETGALVHTIYGKNIRKMDDRIIPSRLEVVPADEEGKKTVIEYEELEFGIDLNPSFFSIRNMKRLP